METKMKSFKHFFYEGVGGKSDTLHAFDMDETIFAHDKKHLKVHVMDQGGNRVRTLTNQEYNNHTLSPGQYYDYSDFKSSDIFHKSARPIRKMLAKMKAIHNNGGKVEIVTARQDFDSKERFGRELGRYGIDINKIHVRRSGNLDPRGHPAVNKANMVSKLIRQSGYKKVHLYDDSESNLDHFLKLKERHPDVDFVAHHVQHDPETDEVRLTTKSS